MSLRTLVLFVIIFPIYLIKNRLSVVLVLCRQFYLLTHSNPSDELGKHGVKRIGNSPMFVEIEHILTDWTRAMCRPRVVCDLRKGNFEKVVVEYFFIY